jgi:predicted nucleotidyltransferase
MENLQVDYHGIKVPRDQLADFCQRNHIRRLSFFGSILRDDFGPESDIDVLVEFEPGTRIGLRFFALERELGDILGRKVDLHTPGFLGKRFRDDVLEQAEDQYVAA